MDPARKSALLWAIVGALSFGVLYQGYVIAGAAFDGRVLAGGMVVVGVVTAVLAPVVEQRLHASI
ncbi:psp operon protein [Salinarchaeum sp. Harcht-Bsk1]|uniref:hypothetical protein n=1 Tax=Salinarchaeum sp. Harcht-Bsk1 TaxID=1333523 RepID=UPI0003424488|nr:hypothetical protein [Salinarchaeum sp. Harcht-Bsk1]AGN01703.1 psp operon protein [Salinarchaeum sp. Harcht-Bsk1]